MLILVRLVGVWRWLRIGLVLEGLHKLLVLELRVKCMVLFKGYCLGLRMRDLERKDVLEDKTTRGEVM